MPLDFSTFSRTIKELKYPILLDKVDNYHSFSRTIKELKYKNLSASQRENIDFQSHHKGIEITNRLNKSDFFPSFSRTIKELKFKSEKGLYE